jgi:hypothetical protein
VTQVESFAAYAGTGPSLTSAMQTWYGTGVKRVTGMVAGLSASSAPGRPPYTDGEEHAAELQRTTTPELVAALHAKGLSLRELSGERTDEADLATPVGGWECGICLETGQHRGLQCDGDTKNALGRVGPKHFVCTGCFKDHVAASSTDELRKQEMRQGRVYCPFCIFPPTADSCDSAPFSDRNVALHCDENGYRAYQEARAKLMEARVAREAEGMVQLRIKVELRKLEQLGAELFEARKHVIEKVLTLACPRCSQAFFEFSGCMALTCSAAACGCHFCGWCLADCGNDSHPHVANCAVKSRLPGRIDRYFATPEQYKEAWKARRIELLESFLDTKEKELQLKLLDNLHQEFTDLGLEQWAADYRKGRRSKPAHPPDTAALAAAERERLRLEAEAERRRQLLADQERARLAEQERLRQVVERARLEREALAAQVAADARRLGADPVSSSASLPAHWPACMQSHYSTSHFPEIATDKRY